MIKYLNEAEKQTSRALWKEAFPEDSEAFLDYYYAEKVRDNRILASLEEDTVAAMVHLNPYELQVRKLRWKVDYLVGVATRADRRHQGYMRRLLMQAFLDMKQAQMPFCFLMPAVEAIYRPFGFTYIFRQPKWRLREEKRPELIKKSWHIENTAEAAVWLERWLNTHYEVFAVRDAAYLHRLSHELASEQGIWSFLYKEERLVGMISEWGLDAREQRFLYCDDAYCETCEEAKPAIMARIIDVREFVKAIHLKDVVAERRYKIRLYLEDALIAENSGIWEWELDHETSALRRIADTQAEPMLYHAAELDGVQEVPRHPTESNKTRKMLYLTIEELTAWLFGYAVPKAATSYTEVVEVLQGVFLDEVV